MTAALKQAHIALTAIFTHPTLELSDFMRQKVAAAITAAEADLSREQPARVGLTEAQANDLWVSATIERTDMRSVYLRGLRDGERAHNIPAAPTQERAR